MWAWSFIRDELEFGAGLAREITQLAAVLNDPGYRMEAHFAVACNAFYRGDFAESLGQSDAGIALYTPELGRLHARYTGQNSGVTNRCYSAYSLWHLGYPDKARSRIRETLALAEELKHPFSLVFGLYHDAFLKQQYRQGEEARQAGETLRTASLEYGFPFWAALGTLSRWTGLLLLGAYGEAVDALNEGLAALTATGAGIVVPYYIGRLAETYLKAGRFDEAARTFDETFALGEKCKELFAEAEWRRLHGELSRIQSNDKAGAESCFRRALETARRQGGAIAGVAGGDEPRPAASGAGPSCRRTADARACI
jgi:tetratricopeptide (TPR) repeat protein